MNEEFKSFVTCVLWAIALLLTIAASAGAINYGIGAGNPSFYAFAGAVNLLGWGGWLTYKAVKFLKKREE